MELTTSDVAVRVCTDDHGASYTFRCPSCRMIVAKPAEPRVVELLVASGVTLHTWRMPAELAERPLGGAPLNHDDLLDFHTMLADDDSWADALTRLVEG